MGARRAKSETVASAGALHPLNIAVLKQTLLGQRLADARNLMDSLTDLQRADLAENLGLFTKQTRSDYDEW
jgi:hypothetical protein